MIQANFTHVPRIWQAKNQTILQKPYIQLNSVILLLVLLFQSGRAETPFSPSPALNN